MNTQELSKKVKGLVGQNKTEKGIILLKQYLSKTTWANEVDIHISNYSHLNDQIAKKCITKEAEFTQFNQLKYKILGLCDKISQGNEPLEEVGLEAFKQALIKQNPQIQKWATYHETLQKLFNVASPHHEKLSLADLYIDPDFSIHAKCFPDSDKRAESYRNYPKLNNPFIHLGEHKDKLHKYILHFLNQENVLNLAHPRAQILLMLGLPGQGKTSFCYRVMSDLIQSNLSNPVVFVRLRNNRQVKALLAHPFKELIRHLGEDEPPEYRIEISEEELGQSIIFLDGLDELFMKEGLTYSDVDHWLHELGERVGHYKDMRIIITSRLGYVDLDQVENEKITIAKLELFSREQQLTWLASFRKTYPEIQLDEQMLKKIHSSSDRHFKALRELVNQPILLFLVAMADVELEQVESKLSLYQLVFKNLIARNWSPKGPLRQYRQLSPQNLQSYLEAIAFEIYQGEYQYIRRQTLGKLPETSVFQEKLSNKDLDDTLRNVMVAFYFQEIAADEKANHAIEFLHKSMQEYLTAESIWKQIKIALKDKTKEKKVLKTLWKAFGTKSISAELLEFLQALIEQESQEQKISMLETLESMSDYFFQCDFFPAETQTSAIPMIQYCVQNFLGWWILMMALNQEKKNILRQVWIERFCFFLKLVPRDSVEHIDLSGQRFEKIENPSRDKLDLLGAFLRGCRMENVYFKEVDLRFADMGNNYLVDAMFELVDLSGARLDGDHLQGMIFQKCQLNETKIGKQIQRISFENADLRNTKLSEGAKFIGANLKKVNFSGYGDARRWYFQDSHMVEANFSNTGIKRARFRNVNLTRANFSGYRVWNNTGFYDSNMFEANFGNAKISDGYFSNVNLEGANFECAKSEDDGMFSANTILRNANFTRANLKYYTFQQCDLTNAIFQHAILFQCKIQGCNFSNVDFTGVKFEDLEVDSILWLENLATQDQPPIGIEELLEKYEVIQKPRNSRNEELFYFVTPKKKP